MSEQENKVTKNLLFAYHWNQVKVSLSTVYKAKKNVLQKKSFLRKMRSGGLNKKQKEGFLTVLTTVI